VKRRFSRIETLNDLNGAAAASLGRSHSKRWISRTHLLRDRLHGPVPTPNSTAIFHMPVSQWSSVILRTTGAGT
jgi:hypothetical protein